VSPVPPLLVGKVPEVMSEAEWLWDAFALAEGSRADQDWRLEESVRVIVPEVVTGLPLTESPVPPATPTLVTDPPPPPPEAAIVISLVPLVIVTLEPALRVFSLAVV